MATIGEIIPIQWSEEDWLDPDGNPLTPPSTVKIELQRDGGTWETIIASTPNTPPYSWTVTGPEATSAILRVSPADGTEIDSGVSGSFTISLGGIWRRYSRIVIGVGI